MRVYLSKLFVDVVRTLRVACAACNSTGNFTKWDNVVCQVHDLLLDAVIANLFF